MSGLAEPLILYLVLFVPKGGAVIPEEFSALQNAAGMLLYTLPALALIWYLLFKVRPLGAWNQKPLKKKNFIAAAIALPALLAIGAAVTLVSRLLAMPAVPPPAPQTAADWAVLAFTCVSSAYLEESYFRFYLLNRLGEGDGRRILISTLLFALCHAWEGPLGVLNAALAGFVLCFIYLRFRAFHGLAWAHGAYNYIAYLLAGVL